MRRHASVAAGLVIAAAAWISDAPAEVPPVRSWTTLVSSNGYGAVVVNLQPSSGAQIHHFREHVFATEEPVIDASGNDVFVSGKPQSVFSRDLLYDTYFGIRANGQQRWLKGEPVNLDQSGYEAANASGPGGTGVIRMVQSWGGLEITQYVFAPWNLPLGSFAMIAKVRNTTSATINGVSVFTLNNFHLGFGRPGPQFETGEENETIEYNATKSAFEERGFAGVVVSRALAAPTHHGASNAASPSSQNVWQLVDSGGTTDLPDLNGAAPTATGSVSAFQKDLGAIAAGQELWFGQVSAHHGDPFGAPTVEAALDTWIAGRGVQQIVDDERALWNALQIDLPPGVTAEQVALMRQSAVVLRMAQVREESFFVRPVLTNDGDVRRSRFGAIGTGKVMPHVGKGAVLASLPPGEWTYAWPRDGAYAIVGMTLAGMQSEAKLGLQYYLGAQGGRFQNYNELSSYAMPAYRISMCRYHGFGVEETDYNDFGPNLEFDGFGLFLWALRTYTDQSGDTSVRHDGYQELTTRVADPILALVDPATGLLKKDSSIWETHWNGRERGWAFTNITAARGLCDAAVMAQAEGDAASASKYLKAGQDLRAAIAHKLTDAQGALAASTEELQSGTGYWDAAVLDGIALGLFDPKGAIATATLAGIQANLATQAGVGWSRNDDRWDHAGGTDVSPWGSEYDSAEWVFTDMRGAVAKRLAGDTAGSDKLIDWVRRQAAVNYLAIAETYDEKQGTYKFNAPMVGFGAGNWLIALYHATGAYDPDPACGAYFDEAQSDAGVDGGGGSDAGPDGSAPDVDVPDGPSAGGSAGAAGNGSGGSAAGAGAGGAGASPSYPTPAAEDDSGCGCRTAPRTSSLISAWWLALVAALLAVASRRPAR